MMTGDCIKIFSESEVAAYMHLVQSCGFRASHKNGYVYVGEKYFKEMTDKEAVAKTIHAARVEKKLGLEELADMLGVVKSTVYHWECGFRLPDKYNREKLQQVLGVEV